MSFTGKTVIVTGGAQGIGMATALAFAREGAQVVIADIDEEAGREHLETLTQAGHQALFVHMDVGDEAGIKRMMETAVTSFGTIDVLINNAGIMDRTPMADRPVKLWDRCIAVNLRGPYLCAKYAVPHMSAGSAIINIASTRALMSEPNTEPYSASKGGLLALTHSLALSLAPRRIRVNAISPGWIDVSNWKKGSRRAQQPLSRRDHEQHPAGHVGLPEDIARACLFLASDDSAGFITGQNFVIDGGMTIKMIYEE